MFNPRPSSLKSGTTDVAVPKVVVSLPPDSVASLLESFGTLRIKREEMKLSNFYKSNKESIEKLKKYEEILDERIADIRHALR